MSKYTSSYLIIQKKIALVNRRQKVSTAIVAKSFKMTTSQSTTANAQALFGKRRKNKNLCLTAKWITPKTFILLRFY